MVITRAPDVHLRRWLVHFTVFKAKSSQTLPMLKSSQIKLFCSWEEVQEIQKNVIYENRGQSQGNINKKDNRYLSTSSPGKFSGEQGSFKFMNTVKTSATNQYQ